MQMQREQENLALSSTTSAGNKRIAHDSKSKSNGKSKTDDIPRMPRLDGEQMSDGHICYLIKNAILSISYLTDTALHNITKVVLKNHAFKQVHKMLSKQIFDRHFDNAYEDAMDEDREQIALSRAPSDSGLPRAPSRGPSRASPFQRNKRKQPEAEVLPGTRKRTETPRYIPS